MAKLGLCDRSPLLFRVWICWIELVCCRRRCSSSRWRGCKRLSQQWHDQRWGSLQAPEGSHITFPHILHPTATQKTLPCSHHHCFQATPSGVWRNQTWSLSSCSWRGWIGTRGSLSSCVPSSGGGHPCPHGTPLLTDGGIKMVYKCWVEACGDGPSISHTAICTCAQRPFGGEVGMFLLCQDLPKLTCP